MAWNPEKFNAQNLGEYYVNWTKGNLGNQNVEEIAEILKLYTKYNSRRKPELLDANTYSITNYNEAENVVKDYKKLAEKANTTNGKLKQEYKDAYYQLVLCRPHLQSKFYQHHIDTLDPFVPRFFRSGLC